MRRLVIAVVFVALVQTVVAAPVSAQSKSEKARQSAKAIRAELARVTAELQRKEAASASARQSAAAARQRLARAKAEETAVQQNLVVAKQDLKDVARDLYMAGGTQEQMTAELFSRPNEAVRAAYLRASVVGVQSDQIDALGALREDLELKRKTAESAARVASDRQTAATRAVESQRALQRKQLSLVSAAEQRYLSSLKEEELARRSRRVPGSRIGLTTVRGITVASSIADNLERLLNAADADGRRFGGSGYRSPDGQVAVRKRNCGTSHYDVYEKPASRCRPPTARPGQSMHEQGLAIDFTYNGSVINSRSNPGYQWLRANAARFGFYNLPSEPWHWSTNGN